MFSITAALKKAKLIGGIITAIIALTVAIVNVSMNEYEKAQSYLSLETVEALAQGEGGGVEQCSIFEYNRNYMEATKFEEITYKIMADGYIEIYGFQIPIGGNITVGITIEVNICAPSDGNCCAKSWITGG